MSEHPDVRDLRAMLAESATLLQKVILATHYVPAAGSVAEREMAEGPSFAGAWGKNPIRDTYSLASLPLAAATEHVATVSRLLEGPAAVFGSAAVARAALETSARAWWLLVPALGTRVRLARGMTERLANLREIRKLLRPEWKDKIAENQQRIEKIAAGAAEQGFNVLPDEKGRPAAVDAHRMPSTDLVGALFGKSGVGQMAYAELSGAAHGVAFAVIGRLELKPDPTHENIGTPAVKLESIRPLLGVVLMGYIAAADRQFAVYGWPADEWVAWRQTALVKSGRIVTGGERPLPEPRPNRAARRRQKKGRHS